MVSTKRPFTLPYEPEYTAHRTVQRQRRNTRLLMHVHMNALQESPSIAPELPDDASSLPAAAPRWRQPH
jgi:hypothetical protein